MDGQLMDNVARGVEVLRAGGLVAFPTETVYGLGADASQPDAVRRIFEAKARPADRPLTVHIGPDADPLRWASFDEDAMRLAAAFWPGPLTLVGPRTPLVPDIVTAGGDTVGVRIPDHPMAITLLTAFGGGVAAPSANRSGRLSPTSAAHVRDDLGDRIDLILDGGHCPGGMESTVLLTGATPRVLRPGAIPRSELEEVLGRRIATPVEQGAGLALNTPIRWWDGTTVAKTSVLLTWGPVGPDSRTAGDEVYQLPADPVGYARALYPALRALDLAGHQTIVVAPVPERGAWEAVANRLQRLIAPNSGSS